MSHLSSYSIDRYQQSLFEGAELLQHVPMEILEDELEMVEETTNGYNFYLFDDVEVAEEAVMNPLLHFPL